LGRLGFADVRGRGDFDYLASFAQQHGFALIQISFDNPRYLPEKYSAAERNAICEKFRSSDIGLCFHGPSDIPLLNRHERIRRAGIECMRELIEMAIEMGGEYFILHPGRLAFYSLSTKQIFYMENRFPDRISALFEDSLGQILELCSGRIQLCIENTHTVSAPFLKVIERMAADKGLGLVWDVGHVEQLSPAKRHQIIKFFQENLRYIKLAHLHDLKEESDHKTLGTGNLNIAGYLEIFRAMSLDIILEVFPEEELLKSLEYIRQSEARE
jgi:sugar phosphate isomerase/epimerase